MSYILYPFAIIMGVVPEDCLQVGRLMGLKTFLNEFVAYQDFGVLQKNRVRFGNMLKSEQHIFNEKKRVQAHALVI